jgi:TetR/AcrR family fatty acid metabolism transcriptional regulator
MLERAISHQNCGLEEMQERKERILTAAEVIMSQKGLAESTIAEIAKKAAVTDSYIYQYFKGKEDLLFSIPGERMKEVLSLLDEHLQGIRDAESQLRKMVWFHLRYNDTHPGYARILFLECRSSKHFYKSPAYQLVRKYAGVLMGILKRGVQDGRFRKDISLSLVRDVILGTLNEETISCVVRREVDACAVDLEDIMSLVHAMVTIRKVDKMGKRDRILLAAERIFADKGFTRATISEIARTAEVAEGTVYEYFRNKEDLLLSIPVKRFKQYVEELPETFEIKNPVRKLRRFIKYHFMLFLTDRVFLKLFLMQIQMNQIFYRSDGFKRFQKYYMIIEDVIEEGKAKGSFRPDINARVFRNMFLGTFSHMALRWVILEKDSEVDKMRELVQITDLLTCAVIKNDGAACH